MRVSLLVAVVALGAACASDDTASDDASTADITTGDATTADITTADSSAPTDTSTTTPTTTGATAASPATTTAATTGSEHPATTVAGDTDPAGGYDFSEIGPVVADFVEARGLNGAGLVVVERDDGIVHEEYWGEFDADRISFIASSSKMATAGVLLHLHDEGLLDIDAPVADAVDWGSANPDISPAHLLSNSSGLVGLLPDPAYGPYVCQFLATGSLQDCAEQIFTTPDDDADVVAPDTDYRYGGAQWQVAGGVAEAVSGKSWAELIDEIYTEPCGLTTFGYNNHFTQLGPGGFDYPSSFDGDLSVLSATDNPNMEGGAYTNARDYARLLLMHLRDGVCGDTTVLSAEALDRMHADRIGPAYGGTTQLGGGYGMGWWTDPVTDVIIDPGAYGAFPWLDIDGGYGAFLVVEATGTDGNALALDLVPLVADAIEARRSAG